MSSAGHNLCSTFVLHFSELWKCGIVLQTEDVVTLPPSHEPHVILYLILHFVEVWKCGIIWQSQDIVKPFPQSWTLWHSLLSSTLLRGVEVLTRDQVSFFPFCSEDEGKYVFPQFLREKKKDAWSQVMEVWKSLSKSGQCPTSPAVTDEPLVIPYLVLQFSDVRKCSLPRRRF